MTHPDLPEPVELDTLGQLSKTPDYAGGGQSTGVWRLPSRPGELFKRYNANYALGMSVTTLDYLIAVPGMLTDRYERGLLTGSTSWPVGRVVHGGQTVGVLVQAAPERFTVTWYSPSARQEKKSTLLLDYLAKPNAYMIERRIPEQHSAQREKICAQLAQIAALLERQQIVYADWSYSNAFWHPGDQSVFLFDIDGCSFGRRPHVATPNFDDPLTPAPDQVDAYVDRYRCALLIARCLTGVRQVDQVVRVLNGMAGDVPRTLRHMITSSNRTDRPPLADLAVAFGAVVTRGESAAGVSGWRTAPTSTTAAAPTMRRRATPPRRIPPAAPPEAAPPPTALGQASVSWAGIATQPSAMTATNPFPDSTEPVGENPSTEPVYPPESRRGRRFVLIGCGVLVLLAGIAVIAGIVSSF